jgi:hypothetical protein
MAGYFILAGVRGIFEVYSAVHARSKLLRVALIIEPRSLPKASLGDRSTIQAPTKIYSLLTIF